MSGNIFNVIGFHKKLYHYLCLYINIIYYLTSYRSNCVQYKQLYLLRFDHLFKSNFYIFSQSLYIIPTFKKKYKGVSALSRIIRTIFRIPSLVTLSCAKGSLSCRSYPAETKIISGLNCSI